MKSSVAIKDKVREEKLNKLEKELKEEFEKQINGLKDHIQKLLEDNAKKDKTNVNNEIDEKNWKVRFGTKTIVEYWWKMLICISQGSLATVYSRGGQIVQTKQSFDTCFLQMLYTKNY